MFRSMTIIRGLYLNLGKVTVAKMFRKIRRYELWSSVAACYVKSIVVWKLPHHCIAHNDVFYGTF
jgi:hypothetical protein